VVAGESPVVGNGIPAFCRRDDQSRTREALIESPLYLEESSARANLSITENDY
jgi:hypothetical protein